MTDELLSLRTILVSGSPSDCDLFRQATSEVTTPIEIVEADGAAAACQAIGGGADFVFIDAALPSADLAQVVSAARAAVRPPFTVLLAAKGTATAALTTDSVAAKPANLQETKRLVERSIRVRIPSRVLLVDDSSTMRSIVRKILSATRFPFEVSEAAEGFAAIKLAGEVEFDIVFLDYNMPGFNGLETLSEFKREKRRMTVVVITSAQDEDLAERVREQGAAFLKKPFYPADIEAVLTRHYGLIALNPKRA
jgi:DNA-binding response OmpR family regulator